jgi:hypothetical protein
MTMTRYVRTNPTLRKVMPKTLATLFAAILVAGCAGAGAPSSEAAILVGVGDQDALTFHDPLWKQLKLRRSRYFAPWDTALKSRRRTERKMFDEWYASATANGVEMKVAFNPSVNHRCPRRPCRLPGVGTYRRAFRRFRALYPRVRVYAPWNEANHRSQPTFKSPKRAAQYYNVVRQNCRGCKVVAADVIDEANMVRWLRVFNRHVRGRPRLWGLHNYKDTNQRRGQVLGGTKKLLSVVRGKVWLTETGGIVKFVLPDGRTLFPFSESRANRATRRMFSLARRYRRRISRLYIYHWKQTSYPNRFDAGLLRNTGKARPAYHTVKRHLRLGLFNP